MPPPFTEAEYLGRLARVRQRMREAGLDLLLVSDPNNIYWLSGAGDWSFYVPQFLLVPLDETPPLWVGRAMDAPGARLTSWLPADRVVGYPEPLVQHRDRHPGDWIGGLIAEAGFARACIGFEADSYYFSPRSLDHLRRALPRAEFRDCGLLVNWARAVKSEAELGYMREAAAIAAEAMEAACRHIRPGVRQCAAVAEIYRTQVAPSSGRSGDITALCPIILAGRMASTAHPIWTEEAFAADQTVAVELAGARRRYTAGLARTLHLGRNPPRQLLDTLAAVREGLDAVLATLKAGVTGHEVHAAWQRVLARHGLSKESRIGYAIGIGFPPDWGEHTISLRAGEDDPILADMTLHVMLGMWMDDWGMELSETVRVLPQGVECLTAFPRDLRIP